MSGPRLSYWLYYITTVSSHLWADRKEKPGGTAPPPRVLTENSAAVLCYNNDITYYYPGRGRGTLSRQAPRRERTFS